MRYRAMGKLRCPTCKKAWLADTGQGDPGFIEAKSEAEAAERFKLAHRLCPTCLQAGIPTAVEFESYIRVEVLS